jgi:hypothetical protein
MAGRVFDDALLDGDAGGIDVPSLGSRRNEARAGLGSGPAELPVPCTLPKAELKYFAASAGADSTLICPQSASISSASTVAMPV